MKDNAQKLIINENTLSNEFEDNFINSDFINICFAVKNNCNIPVDTTET